MIDGLTVFYHFFWVLGLASFLAVFSFAHWQASQQKRPLRHILAGPSFRLMMGLSFILFTLGMMLTADQWWLKIGWIGLMLLALWDGFTAWRERSDI